MLQYYLMGQLFLTNGDLTMKEIINLLKDMELEKISPKEVLLKIEDILNFEFDEFNHTYKLPDGTILQIKIENDLLFVEYGEDIYCKNLKSEIPLYKLYWESNSELKEHGNFNSVEDAYNSINKWWEKIILNQIMFVYSLENLKVLKLMIQLSLIMVHITLFIK